MTAPLTSLAANYSELQDEESPNNSSNMGRQESNQSDGSSTSSTPSLPLLEISNNNRGNQDEMHPSRRSWAVTLYCITTALLFADQNLLAPNLSAVADEFNFTELERDQKLGGDIALAFWLLGAPASFIVGCLADQTDRSALFALTVAIGEGACLATYFSNSYRQLYLCRAITGFSVGGALPLIYSVLGDLYSADERHGVSAIVGIGTGIGIGIGQGVAGFLGPTFGWRLPFLVVSVPALVCAAMVLFTVEDPPRGGMEKVALQQRGQQKQLYELRSTDNDEKWADETLEEQEARLSPSSSSSSFMVELTANRFHDDRPTRDTDVKKRSKDFVGEQPLDSSTASDNCDKIISDNGDILDVYADYGCTTAPLSSQDWMNRFQGFLKLIFTPTVLLAILQGAPGCVPWGIINTYLNDYLSENRGMTVEGATLVVLVFGIGNVLGMIFGGTGGNYLYRLDLRYPALLAGSTAVLGCIPFWLLINNVSSNSSLVAIIIISCLSGIGSGVTGPIIKATLQNVTLPTHRGQAFAVFNTFDDFGRGLGPVFVALLIAKMGDRTPAFNVGVLGWVICGVLNLSIFFTVKRDEQKVQLKMAENLTRANDALHQGQTNSVALFPQGDLMSPHA